MGKREEVDGYRIARELTKHLICGQTVFINSDGVAAGIYDGFVVSVVLVQPSDDKWHRLKNLGSKRFLNIPPVEKPSSKHDRNCLGEMPQRKNDALHLADAGRQSSGVLPRRTPLGG